MLIFLLITILIVILLIVFDVKIQEQAQKHFWIRLLKYFIIAMIILFALFSLIFTVGETTANDISGFSHLIPLLPLGIIAYLLLRKQKVDKS